MISRLILLYRNFYSPATDVLDAVLQLSEKNNSTFFAHQIRSLATVVQQHFGMPFCQLLSIAANIYLLVNLAQRAPKLHSKPLGLPSRRSSPRRLVHALNQKRAKESMYTLDLTMKPQQAFGHRCSVCTAPFVTDPAHRSPVVITIDFSDSIHASHICSILRQHVIVDTEPYRKLQRNQMRIATFASTKKSDINALIECIEYVVEPL